MCVLKHDRVKNFIGAFCVFGRELSYGVTVIIILDVGKTVGA
jgi:hypothetical protein